MKRKKRKRRSIEAYVLRHNDAPFKPKVIPSKKAYNRKRKKDIPLND